MMMGTATRFVRVVALTVFSGVVGLSQAADPPKVEVDYKQNYELAPNSSSRHVRYQTSTVRTYYNSKEIRSSAAHIVKISVPAGWKATIDAEITELVRGGNPYYLWYDLSCNGHAIREYGDSAKRVATQTVYSDCYAAVISRCLPESGSSCSYNVSYSIAVQYERSGPVVKFNANGGSGEMDAQEFSSGVTQGLSANRFYYSGHMFAGWATSPDGKAVYSDGQRISTSSDMTLYAVWKVSKPTFTVVNGKLTGVKLNGATAVTIPSTVTSIGDEVFRDCKGLASVKIPKGVKSIGRLAFSDCSGLTSVTLPSSVTSIGDWAFYGCSGLKSLTIPSSVKSIGAYAFYSCGYLDKVQIGAGVTKIGAAAFGNCKIVSLVVASANGAYEMSGSLLVAKSTGKIVAATCQIYKLTIPDSVTSIGAWAFSGCEELYEVTIPASVTSIDDNAFCNCRKLAVVAMPRRFQGNLPSGVFSNCSSSLQITYFDAPAPTTYTVTFSANGGKVSETKRKVKKDAAVGTLPKATRTGYALKGWYTAKSGGSKVSTSTKVSKNVTYYAQWTANKYNIKFNANGGTGSMKTLSATYGKIVTLTANAFKKPKYTFAGWATTKGGSVAYKNKAKVKNLTATKGKTVTIYAVWKKAKSSGVKSAATVATAVPAWAVGTFYGGEASLAAITVSVSGKVEGIVFFAGGAWTIDGMADGQCIRAVMTDENGGGAVVFFAIKELDGGGCRIESEDGSIWAERWP